MLYFFAFFQVDQSQQVCLETHFNTENFYSKFLEHTTSDDWGFQSKISLITCYVYIFSTSVNVCLFRC